MNIQDYKDNNILCEEYSNDEDRFWWMLLLLMFRYWNIKDTMNEVFPQGEK